MKPCTNPNTHNIGTPIHATTISLGLKWQRTQVGKKYFLQPMRLGAPGFFLLGEGRGVGFLLFP